MISCLFIGYYGLFIGCLLDLFYDYMTDEWMANAFLMYQFFMISSKLQGPAFAVLIVEVGKGIGPYMWMVQQLLSLVYIEYLYCDWLIRNIEA